MQAQVAQVTLGEPLGRLGDEHLPAVARRHDPGGSVHVHADITVLADKRLAGVDPDSNANRPLSQRRLPRRCRGQCILHTPERDEQRVAPRVHLHSGVRGERLPQHPPMLRQHFRVRLGPSSCSKAVEPSISVKRNVTVPEGVLASRRTSTESSVSADWARRGPSGGRLVAAAAVAQHP